MSEAPFRTRVRVKRWADQPSSSCWRNVQRDIERWLNLRDFCVRFRLLDLLPMMYELQLHGDPTLD